MFFFFTWPKDLGLANSSNRSRAGRVIYNASKQHVHGGKFPFFVTRKQLREDLKAYHAIEMSLTMHKHMANYKGVNLCEAACRAMQTYNL